MRAEFARAIAGLAQEFPRLVVLTEDLGYMALEDVARAFGHRFINCGVSEQNTVAVAAGLAREGWMPWVYSIAPFTVLRPYEQIRNDVCLHRLPVKLVGNGGGFGYGIMGPTHHTLEDIAVMRVLPHMKVYVPLTEGDTAQAVRAMVGDPSPNYLRLNLPARIPVPVVPFAPWRKIKEGRSAVVIGTGPILGNLFALHDPVLADALEIWAVSLFPVPDFPDALLASVRDKQNVVTIEEHYGQCGLNETLAAMFLERSTASIRFTTLHARGYPSGRYGSQQWHLEENGLAGAPLTRRLQEIIHA